MVTAVIPSRFHSSRFPGKALTPIAGIPLVVRVARAVRDAAVVDRVLVATDDERIAAALAGEPGVGVAFSREPFRSGSDRVAAAVAALEEGDGDRSTVLNVQGDEPLVDRAALEQALAALDGNDLGTVALAARWPPGAGRDTVVVERDPRSGRALAFARADADAPAPALVHLGIYAFTRASLARFAALPRSDAERAHDLEQLRALDHGMTIGVRVLPVSRHAYQAVNRPEDVPRVEALLTRKE
jgi:3-deoxy-manno-octulosonate cytidylyltransferase (CMP-KDO synthetase)